MPDPLMETPQERLTLAMTASLMFAPVSQAQFMDADDLNTFCQQKHPVVAGVLDRWSRDLLHAEMSDVVDTENNRPESKVPVTEKVRANVCDPDTITLESEYRLRLRRCQSEGIWPQR